ncbi:hypothetical protein [Methanocella conradii]|uniref:hypothetical protein n=1 Tax=Methanocella conradii TaxID=1175444 RepID=UPI00157DF49E|nr:hypothetical protein [Methanocella conradii]
MVSKTRTLTNTSYTRYEEKAYSVHFARSGSPELAMRTAAAQVAQWQSGFGELHTSWLKVKNSGILTGVNTIFYGLYHAAAVQYISKVIRYGKMSTDEWLNYWTNKGLDAGVLARMGDILGGETMPAEA